MSASKTPGKASATKQSKPAIIIEDKVTSTPHQKPPPLNGSPSIPPHNFRRFLFKILLDNPLNILLCRKQNYYIKSVKIDQEPTWQNVSNHFIRCAKSNRFKKYLKVLSYIKIRASTHPSFDKCLFQCRQAKRIQVSTNYTCYNNIIERGLTPYKLNSIKQALTKRAIGLFLTIHDDLGENRKLHRRLFMLVKKKLLKEFLYDLKLGVSDYKSHQNNKVSEFLTTLVKFVAGLDWIEYLRFSDQIYFLNEIYGYEYALNGISSIKELSLSKWDVGRPVNPDPKGLTDLKWAEAKGKPKVDKMYHQFWKSLTSFPKLIFLRLGVDRYSSGFLQNIAANSKKLRRLQVSITYDLLDHDYTTQMLEKTWENLCKGPELEDLRMKITSEKSIEKATMSLKPSGVLSMKSLSGLKKLKRFEFMAHWKWKTIELGDLGKAFQSLPNIEIFKIRAYIMGKEFEEFLSSSTNCLKDLKELELDIKYNCDIDIQPSFVPWMNSKQKIKYLAIRLGAYQYFYGDTIITASTLKNCLKGVLQLTKLTHLELAIGFEKGALHDFIFRKFESNEEKHMVSNFLKDLKGIRKLILGIGPGYLYETELTAILAAIKANSSLSYFAFGAHMKRISKKILEQMVASLYEFKKKARPQKVLMISTGAAKDFQAKLYDLIYQLYNEKVDSVNFPDLRV